MYYIKVTNLVNGEVYYLTNIIEFMHFKSDVYVLRRKIKKIKQKFDKESMRW